MGSQRIPIRCDECNTPVAELQGELLIIRSRHLGRPHVTAISVRQLAEQCGILKTRSDRFSDEERADRIS